MDTCGSAIATGPAGSSSERPELTHITGSLDAQGVSRNLPTCGVGRDPEIASLLTIPVELLPQITATLGPADLLALTRTCKALRRIFMSKSSCNMWKWAERNVHRLPWRPGIMSSPQYAALLFTNDCSLCGHSGPNNQLEATLRVRLCGSCYESELLDIRTIENYERSWTTHIKRLPILTTTTTGATRCLRRDFQVLVETHERFLQSGDRAELNIWDRNRRYLVGYFDEFAEMLHRFLIYPELTPREKYGLGLYEEPDGGEEYSGGVEEPSNEEDHSSMEESIGEDGEYMEEEDNAGEAESSMDESD
ncbi:hypothetical protein FRC08_012946 [Ceratobasidium sp. 394]|nr:hypothetical protein FRC08_012946 [Ceratobasidium sp. 394]